MKTSYTKIQDMGGMELDNYNREGGGKYEHHFNSRSLFGSIN